MGVRNNPKMAATKMFDLARNQIQRLETAATHITELCFTGPNFLCDQKPVSPGLRSATPMLDSPGIKSQSGRDFPHPSRWALGRT
jgi:hypothetical protein